MKEKINKKICFEILAIVLIAIFCISITPKTLQNDTFYTIKIGEHIIQNQEFQEKMKEAAQINDPEERAAMELLLQEQFCRFHLLILDVCQHLREY